MTKSILAIGPHNEANIWLEAATSLGYDIIVIHPHLTTDSNLYKKIIPYVNQFYNVDYSDIDQIKDICIKHNVVMTLCLPCPNNVLKTVAEINTSMGLVGLDQESAQKCCNKLNFQKLLEENELPRPSYTKRVDEILVENHDNFPCILKPAFGAGGMEIRKLSSSIELKENFSQWQKKLINKRKNDFFLLQDFIAAPFHMGCNCVVKNGKLIVLSHNVRDIRGETWLPFFQENIFPCEQTGFLSEKNYLTMQKLVDAIGLNNWPLKIEAFVDIDKNIQSFIEVNLRPGGTRSPLAFNKILGFNYALEQIKLSSPDHECNFVTNIMPEAKFLMIKNFRFKPGKVNSVKWFKPRENISSFYTEIKEGSLIPPHWDVAVAQMCGELILTGNSVSELRKECQQIESEVHIEYEKQN